MATQKITSAFATPAQVADILGVPPARARLLIGLAKRSGLGVPVGADRYSVIKVKSHARKAKLAKTRKRAAR